MKQGEKVNDQAVTPIISILLLLPTITIGAVVVMTAYNDFIDSQREYLEAKTYEFEMLADCARNPQATNPYCDRTTESSINPDDTTEPEE